MAEHKTTLQKAKAKIVYQRKKVEDYTKKNPKKALGIAAGVGAGLGLAAGAATVALMKRRK